MLSLKFHITYFNICHTDKVFKTDKVFFFCKICFSTDGDGHPQWTTSSRIKFPCLSFSNHSWTQYHLKYYFIHIQHRFYKKSDYLLCFPWKKSDEKDFLGGFTFQHWTQIKIMTQHKWKLCRANRKGAVYISVSFKITSYQQYQNIRRQIRSLRN